MNYKREGFHKIFRDQISCLRPVSKRTRSTYSWKANNGFKLRDLIPAVSITLGANAVLKRDTPTLMAMFLGIYPTLHFGNLGVGPEQEPL